jgi:RNA polymerase sigma factor (sigma-70 family)
MEFAYGPTTDAGLLHRLKDAKNDSAWSLFTSRYEPVITQRCQRWRLQPADAEEVTSIVLVKLAQSLAGFEYDPARRFRGWLRVMVDNAVRDFLRMRRRRPGNIGSGDTGAHQRLEQIEAPADSSEPGQPNEDAEWNQLEEVWEVVERVRSRSEPKTWKAFWMTAMEGRPAREVAAELGISAAAVYQNKKRIGDRLRREALQGHDPSSGEVPP